MFPIFVLECRDHAQEQGLAVAPLDTMKDQCETLDGAALVEYARDLMQQGCVLSLPGGRHRLLETADRAIETTPTSDHRQMQIAAQWLDSDDSACTWDDMNDRAAEVDTICCEGTCHDGFPSTCNPMCAIIYHQFTLDCGAGVQSILGGDARWGQLQAFESTCIDNLDADGFLEAIAGADCGDDVLGRAEVCNEAADLDITFLGDESDSSGNHRGVRMIGDCQLTPTGVHFDGDGDYFTVHSWNYAADATFSISVWMVKEECTAGLYEYLYSHQMDDQVGTDQIAENGVANAFVMFYIGCEGQGSVTSNLDGSIMRFWVQDDHGTQGVFDYPLHDAGSFDAITEVWTHVAYVVTPGSLKTFDDGRPVNTAELGFPSTANNQAMPDPTHLGQALTTMNLASDLYIGGRADRAGDRHFKGTMAMLMVDNVALSDEEIMCYFETNEATLAALPPVVPPPSRGGPISCPMAVAAMLSPGQGGRTSIDVCLGDDRPACEGRCGTLWTQIQSSCADAPQPGVDCTATACSQADSLAFNSYQLKQIGAMCGELPEGCEPQTMMPIVQTCDLPNPGGGFDPSWRPQCPCDSDFLAPLIACADSFGVTLGMDPVYISSVTRAAAGGCAGGESTVDTVPTDGTEVTGIVTDTEGVLFQFHATAGTTYLLDTEVGTLLDTVMVLIDSDQTTSIAENDDDERANGHLDSYIEWTCARTGMYYVNVYGFGGDTGTITLSINTAGVGGGGDPCAGGATMSEDSAVISFTPMGGTSDNQDCAWLISCTRGTATLSIERFETEQDFDFVTLYDGRDRTSTILAHMSGPMNTLPRLSYSSSSTSMRVEFSSDESIGAEGFEASYVCGAPPPPPPPGPVFTVLDIVDQQTSGEVFDAAGTWFQFDASAGNTYQLETDAVGLADTMMVLVDTDMQTTLAENDDDTRDSGRLDSYIEWTCPADGTYFINVKGFSGATGTFMVSVTMAGGDTGGDPCGEGGITFHAPAASVSYTPEGGTLDDTDCMWTIVCGAGQQVDMSFTRFSTEEYFDMVSIYDGTRDGDSIGSLSGELSDLAKKDFVSTQSSVVVEFITDASIGADGFEMQYACSGGSGGGSSLNVYVEPSVEFQSTSVGGHDTYVLTATPIGTAASAYTIFGSDVSLVRLPAAYQVATPFGSNTGGTNPAFWAVANNDAMGYAQYDSWLTVGITDGDPGGALSSIGFDWTTWTEAAAFSCNDCAVFWMSPDLAPVGPTVVGQITVASGSSGSVNLGLQGRSAGGGTDWQAHNVAFAYP